MALLIKGGTVVGPAGAHAADVLVDGEPIAAVFAPGRGAEGIETLAPRGTSSRRRRRAHPHGTPFVHVRERHLRNRHPGRRHGCTTTIIDFAVQRPGEVCGRPGRLAQQGRGQTATSTTRSTFLGGVDDDALKAMDQLVDEGISSFQAVHGYRASLFRRRQVLRAMQRARENGSVIMMQRETGIAIDV